MADKIPLGDSNVEQDVLAAAKDKAQHNERLQACLGCLQYHVWSDGTPMKNRSSHRYKTAEGRTRVRDEQ